MKKYTRVLTIAGSDSGGGAGIQADLKTIMASGCYGMSVITAITAQNTLGVTDIHPIPIATIRSQMQAVLSDIGTDGIKIGMLHSAEVIKCVAETLAQFDSCPIVLDPVMVATSGDRLIKDDAIEAMKEHLFPLATLLTPNIPEAEVLLGGTIDSETKAHNAAQALANQYGVGVLVKGGHLSDAEVEDVLCMKEGGDLVTFKNKRISTTNTHGTGCTLSSAIASYLALGNNLYEAIQKASQYLHGAIKAGSSYRLGAGNGPVHHSYLMGS